MWGIRKGRQHLRQFDVTKQNVTYNNSMQYIADTLKPSPKNFVGVYAS